MLLAGFLRTYAGMQNFDQEGKMSLDRALRLFVGTALPTALVSGLFWQLRWNHAFFLAKMGVEIEFLLIAAVLLWFAISRDIVIFISNCSTLIKKVLGG